MEAKAINRDLNIYRFYIGSNNETKKTEIEKARNILNKYFDVYSIFKGFGIWKGEAENSFIVELCETADFILNQDDLKKVVVELKTELQQEAILMLRQKQEAYLI